MHRDEVEVIAKFREEGFADLNIRDGGEGFTSESSRELWAQPSHREAIERARSRISEGARTALMQRWQDPEARARMIALSSVPNARKSNPGSRNGNSKLVESDVAEIKAKLAAGCRQKDVARDYGVSQSLVSLISRGEAWPHVRVD